MTFHANHLRGVFAAAEVNGRSRPGNYTMLFHFYKYF